MRERTLSGYFCDDIRQEVGGKTSLIGCYGPDMIVPEFPVTLSKLCAAVTVGSPSNRPFTELRVVVLRGDEELTAAEIPAASLLQMKALSGNSAKSPADTRHIIAVNFVMSPVTIDSPCVLRVRAYAEGEVLKGLAIKIDSGEARPSITGVMEKRAVTPKRSKAAKKVS